MPLHLQVRRPDTDVWVSIGTVQPGLTGSISDNPASGSRQVYVFGCAADDSHSVLIRLALGYDLDVGSLRAYELADLVAGTLVATITKESSFYRRV